MFKFINKILLITVFFIGLGAFTEVFLQLYINKNEKCHFEEINELYSAPQFLEDNYEGEFTEDEKNANYKIVIINRNLRKN